MTTGFSDREVTRDFDKNFIIYLIIYFLFRAALAAFGSSQARGPNGATAASPPHSHSNSGSELHLRSTPQLTAMLDP